MRHYCNSRFSGPHKAKQIHVVFPVFPTRRELVRNSLF